MRSSRVMSDIEARLIALYNNRDHDEVLTLSLTEIERLRDNLQRATSMPTATEAARNVALEKKVDQQQAEIERLRVDAARYRFIRQDIGGLGVYIVNGNLEVLSLDEADKAIDASREAVGYE